MVGIKKSIPTPLFHEFTSIIHIIDNATPPPPLPLLPTCKNYLYFVRVPVHASFLKFLLN